MIAHYQFNSFSLRLRKQLVTREKHWLIPSKDLEVIWHSYSDLVATPFKTSRRLVKTTPSSKNFIPRMSLPRMAKRRKTRKDEELSMRKMISSRSLSTKMRNQRTQLITTRQTNFKERLRLALSSLTSTSGSGVLSTSQTLAASAAEPKSSVKIGYMQMAARNSMRNLMCLKLSRSSE